MARSTVRAYAALRDFLSAERADGELVLDFSGTPSVKDAIESVGIPHTEVDLILVDGRAVGFGHLLRGGERVAIYPAFMQLDATPLNTLLPEPPAEFRFVLDVHLGRLARYLRLAGFDCLYQNTYADRQILELAQRDDRTILTRDTGLLKHAVARRGYWLRSTRPREQFAEVVDRFRLCGRLRPFSRCMVCNGTLSDLDAGAARRRVPQRVARNFDCFRICNACGRIYWPGSHYERLLRLLEDAAGTHSSRLEP